MEKQKGLHLVYKKVGETPLQTINRFKVENPEYKNIPITYAGRLDPMAEGLLLLLSGDLVYEKEKYLGLPKTYEFEVLWGFETDTLDLLGLVVESQKVHKICKVEELEDKINQFVGKLEQKYPAYSSKPVDGKPLFMWAREGKLDEIKIPSHEVEVFSTSFVSRRIIEGRELLKEIENKISLVSGDFRQVEILEQWKDVLDNKLDQVFTVDRLKVNASSGFYVRQFVSDLAKNLENQAATLSIYRAKIGEYELASLS
jgi:tRNA pseudouridine(55) synthase